MLPVQLCLQLSDVRQLGDMLQMLRQHSLGDFTMSKCALASEMQAIPSLVVGERARLETKEVLGCKAIQGLAKQPRQPVGQISCHAALHVVLRNRMQER
eukprot:3134889-Rhodomonas_salina.1